MSAAGGARAVVTSAKVRGRGRGCATGAPAAGGATRKGGSSALPVSRRGTRASASASVRGPMPEPGRGGAGRLSSACKEGREREERGERRAARKKRAGGGAAIRVGRVFRASACPAPPGTKHTHALVADVSPPQAPPVPGPPHKKIAKSLSTHRAPAPPPLVPAPAGWAPVFDAARAATPAGRVLDHPEPGGQALVGGGRGRERGGGGIPGGGRRHL